MLDHLKKNNYTYLLVLCISMLSIFGLIMVYSASFPMASVHYGDAQYFFSKQFRSLCIGFLFLFITALIPYRLYGKLIPPLLILSLISLILVLVPGIGVERNHSQRWLQVGPLLLQPTEAVKLVMIIYFAYVYAKKQDYINDFWRGVMPPLLILTTVFFLILKQPDLGTAATILIPCAIILLCAGVRLIHLFLLGSVALAGVSYVAISSTYRLKRLLSFHNPLDDPLGDGYQLLNSLSAIASGGMAGQGLGNSLQKFGMLPEAHTDFIMAIILEELGTFGLLFIVLSYIFIMYQGVRISLSSKDPFAKLLALGLTFQIMVQVMFNLGAVSGLLPITGVPLPFISYGGSSLVTMFITLGIIINLSRNLKKPGHSKKKTKDINVIS